MANQLLEDKYKDDFERWSRNPSRENMGTLLKIVQPEINRGLSAFVSHPNPVIKGKARKLTLDAIKSYNPSKAKLGTHIVNHMQGLRRQSRKQLNILAIPERVMIDQGHLEQARVELADSLGRDPSITELADRSKISIKRINHLKNFNHPLAEGTILGANATNPDAGAFLPMVDQTSGVWQELVYDDLANTDKKIMEWTLGLHGEQVLSNSAIAQKLRLSPGAISQRKQNIQKMLDKQQELSPFNG